MNDKNLVICDKEFRYADSLGENICEREDLAVKVYICSSLEQVSRLSKHKQIHMFIVDEEYTGEERNKIDAVQTFVLTRAKAEDIGEGECEIYKYQNADEIIRIIFETYVEKTKQSVMRSLRKDRAVLVAVYSPIHRVGKTRFALALGRCRAKKEKVLYLSLEEYAGFTEGVNEGMNTGDLLYYIKQGNQNVGIRLQAAVRKTEELDCLPPIPIALDLKEVTLEEWQSLLQEIRQNSIYDLVILDVGESVQGLFQILEMCDRVYMPILEDEISERKLAQYNYNLEQLKLERLAHITYRFVMPEDVETYVRTRVREEW